MTALFFLFFLNKYPPRAIISASISLLAGEEACNKSRAVAWFGKKVFFFAKSFESVNQIDLSAAAR